MIKPVDLGMIQQINNATQVKQHENAKPVVDQQNITAFVQKDADNKSEQVRHKDNADHDQRKFDAKDKSDNEYYDGQNQKKKENHSDGKVFLKGMGSTSFDIKI
jgi:hypothetical protein